MQQLLTGALDIAFFALVAITFIAYVRHPTPIGRDTVLIFSSVGLVLALGPISSLGKQLGWWGEIPVAIVVLKPGQQLNQEELLLSLKPRIAKYKMPRLVQFVEGPLPKTGTGKMLKRQLREAFWSGKATRVQG